MHKPRTALFFSAVWFSLPLFLVASYLAVLSKPQEDSIRKHILSTSTGKTSGEILDALPGLFTKLPALSAAYVTNGNLLSGSIYEKRRLAAEEYQNFLSGWIDGSFQHPVPSGMHVSRLSLGNGFELTVLLRNRIPWQDNWFVIRRENKSMPIALTVYFLAGIILLFLLFGKKPETDLARPEKAAAPRQAKPAPRPALEKSPVRSHAVIHIPEISYSQAKELLSRVFSAYSVKRAAYFMPKNGVLDAVIEMRGKMFIKGDAIKPLPPLVNSLAGTANPGESLPYADESILYIPVHDSNILTGLFRIEFTETPDENTRASIAEFARKTGLQFTKEEKFDQATQDAETGLLSGPAFFFSLKEKLLTRADFTLFITEFPDFEKVSKENKILWGKRLRLDLSEGTLAARLSDNRFAFLIANSPARDIHLTHNTGVIRNAAKSVSSRLFGVVVSGLSDFRSLNTYLSAIDHEMLLAKSKMEFPRIAAFGLTGVLRT